MKKINPVQGKNDFQKEIQTIMKTYNLSEEAIAAKLQIRAQTVIRWAKGLTKPKSRIVLLAYEEFKKALQQKEKI